MDKREFNTGKSVELHKENSTRLFPTVTSFEVGECK
jgi:hypothetical protein